MRAFLDTMYLMVGFVIWAQHDKDSERLVVRVASLFVYAIFWPVFFVARVYSSLGK